MEYKDLITIILTILLPMLSGFGWVLHKMENQSHRTDRLYEMFIDLLKEKKS